MPRIKKPTEAQPVSQDTPPADTPASLKKGPKTKPKAKSTTSGRKVVYPDIGVKVYSPKHEAGSLTAEEAKTILGWEVVTDGNYMLTDVEGNKVRCYNNGHNRPYNHSNALTYSQEILRGHWKLNGETMIIGKTGETVSAQHRLVGLILAVQEWTKQPDKYPAWKKAPTMDCIIVFGISEDDSTVNTIDTGKPRSLSDVIYRSVYFADLNEKQRLACSRICQYAITQVWERTGVDDALGIRKTHAEALDFLGRHSKLLEAVKHIYEEDGQDGRITKTVGTGYAAGLLYLMGSGSTDPSAYQHMDSPNETVLDWSLWDDACDFWVEFATGKKLNALREAINAIKVGTEVNGEMVYGTREEVIALVIKAWTLFAAGKPVTAEEIALKYETDTDGYRTLAECPTVGGIDIGVSDDLDPVAPSPEEIAASKSAIAQEAVARKAKTMPKGKVAKVTTADVGHVVWVVDPDAAEESSWSGTLEELYDAPSGKVARVKVGKGFSGHGKTFEVPADHVKTVAP